MLIIISIQHDPFNLGVKPSLLRRQCAYLIAITYKQTYQDFKGRGYPPPSSGLQYLSHTVQTGTKMLPPLGPVRALDFPHIFSCWFQFL